MAVQTAEIKSSEFRRLQSALGNWDARLRLRQTVIWLPRGLLIGLIAALAVALAARLWPLTPRQNVITLGGLLALIGVAGALAGVWLWRRTPLDLARRFDRLFGLKERLSTAIELAQGALIVESPLLVRQQFDQTLRVAERVEAARHLPLRPERREGLWWGGAAIALLALGLAIWLPNPQETVLAQQAEVEQAIAGTLEELQQLREQATTDPSLTPEEQQAVVETLDEAIQTLSQQEVTQEEALAALDSAQQQLNDLSQQFAAERQQALEQASGLLNGTAAQQTADALAQGDLQAAAEALQNLDPASLTPEQQQQLAEALQAAADSLQSSDPQAAQALEDAAQALQSGDAASADQALNQAGQAMAEASSSSTESVDQYADQVGKGESTVAGAGKNPSDQPGQGGMGQASQAGAGSGQQQGQGQPGGGAGRGEGGGEGQPGGQSGQMPTDNGPGDGGERPFDDVYSPQRIGGEGGDQVDIPGNPGAGQPTGSEGNFADNPSGESTVPYNQVWADYWDAINQALEGGYVPLGLRDLIKQYFSGLAPGVD